MFHYANMKLSKEKSLFFHDSVEYLNIIRDKLDNAFTRFLAPKHIIITEILLEFHYELFPSDLLILSV